MASKLQHLRVRIVIASVTPLLLYLTRFYVWTDLLVFVMFASAAWTCSLIGYYFWLILKKVIK